VAALPLPTTGPSFDHFLKICTVRFIPSPLEITNCGIAASASHVTDRKKISYDLENKREFGFFPRCRYPHPQIWIFIWPVTCKTPNFSSQRANLTKLALPCE
jgi:hypothetical protein